MGKMTVRCHRWEIPLKALKEEDEDEDQMEGEDVEGNSISSRSFLFTMFTVF